MLFFRIRSRCCGFDFSNCPMATVLCCLQFFARVCRSHRTVRPDLLSPCCSLFISHFVRAEIFSIATNCCTPDHWTEHDHRASKELSSFFAGFVLELLLSTLYYDHFRVCHFSTQTHSRPKISNKHFFLQFCSILIKQSVLNIRYLYRCNSHTI